jgi:hypothetical protein
MLTSFAANTGNELYEVWKVSMWKIHDIPLTDKYGFTQEHPNFTLDIDDSYADTLPKTASPMAMALQYAKEWNLSYYEVMDMAYAEFYNLVNIQKALSYKRPWWKGQAGEEAYVYEKASGKRLNKPRRTQQ